MSPIQLRIGLGQYLGMMTSLALSKDISEVPLDVFRTQAVQTILHFCHQLAKRQYIESDISDRIFGVYNRSVDLAQIELPLCSSEAKLVEQVALRLFPELDAELRIGELLKASLRAEGVIALDMAPALDDQARDNIRYRFQADSCAYIAHAIKDPLSGVWMPLPATFVNQLAA